MTKPIRIQLSRAKGFNLQTFGRSANGLETVNCARPSQFGNPFIIGKVPLSGWNFGEPVKDASQAVDLYREQLTAALLISDRSVDALLTLRGKNLACWCALDAPCHADVLLELANAPDAPQAERGTA